MPGDPPVPHTDNNPLSGIPPEVGEQLRPSFAAVTDEIVTEIQSRVAEYARPRDENYIRVIRTAVERALSAFVDRIGKTDTRSRELHEKFRSIGAGEAHEGRSLDSLQTAMRSAAVIAWRRLTSVSEREGLPRQYISLLAEAAFLFLEEIAGAAAEGYSQARAKVAGELQRRRGRLINLLLSEDAVAMGAISDLARTAEWRVPATIAVVALHGRETVPMGMPSLPPEVLVDVNRLDPRLVVPDPHGPGRLRSLSQALSGWIGAMGPAVDVTRAADSLRRAQDTLALMRKGVISDTGIARWDDHLTEALLFGDTELVRSLAEARLAPLAQLRSAQRDRMAATLLCWLQSGYNANEVATRLHVHPQTVRYRLRQLERLFGDGLRDPERRFELEIALRARRLGAQAAPVETAERHEEEPWRVRPVS